jgi:20S proteasome subunit alpha 2
LEKRYRDNKELKDAIHTALLTLCEGFEGEMAAPNTEVRIVSTKDRVFPLLPPAQVQDYLDEAT